MGNSESTPVPCGGTEGYHVLRDKDDETFKSILSQSVERPLELTVYNSKSQTVRQTQITPSNTWGGQGILGISIRFCSFEGANQNVWHIVSVQPNSPAEVAGLQADVDYVLGAESVLQQADDLIALVQANIGKPVKLYVYSLTSDSVREVTLTPNESWGGEGCLGCDIGYGYLHRIPISVDRSAPTIPVVSNGTEALKSQFIGVAQPGSTGIPQVDNIKVDSTPQPPSHRFPDPSEFAVPPPVSIPFSQPSYSSTPPIPANPVPSYEAPPGLPPQLPPATPVEQVTSTPATLPPNVAPVAPPSSAYQCVPPPTFSAPAMVPPPSQAPVPSPPGPTAYNNMGFPPPLPVASSHYPTPPVPAASVYNFTPTSLPEPPSVALEQRFGALSVNQYAPPKQSEPPINTSSYQPYLAYGSPAAPTPTYQAPPVAQTEVAPPPVSYYQPPTNYSNNQSAQSVAPPPINFPMPPLSSLGISDLVPPASQPYPAQPQY